MKQTLVFILLFCFSSTLFAQNTPLIKQLGNNQRTETYPFFIGGDSVRYTISGTNDTMLTELFWSSGQISSKAWRKDSIYYYYGFGQLAAKRYLSTHQEKVNTTDSTIYYSLNGLVYGETIIDKNDQNFY